jgi:hypothetical protein
MWITSNSPAATNWYIDVRHAQHSASLGNREQHRPWIFVQSLHASG